MKLYRARSELRARRLATVDDANTDWLNPEVTVMELPLDRQDVLLRSFT